MRLLAGLPTVFPRMQHLWVDGGYRRSFLDWVEEQLGWTVEKVLRLGAGSRRVITLPGMVPIIQLGQSAFMYYLVAG